MWQVGGLQDDESGDASGASSTERWLRGIETLLLGGGERFTAEEVRAAAGVDEEWSQRLWRAIGFPEIPPGVRALTPADLEALTQVAALRRAGLGDDDLVNVTRTASLAMARIADAVTAESTVWANVMGATDESSSEHVDPLATFDSLLSYLSRRQLLAAVLWRTPPRVTTSTGRTSRSGSPTSSGTPSSASSFRATTSPNSSGGSTR